MKEAQRYIRYSLPGLIFFIEIGVALIITHRYTFCHLENLSSQLTDILGLVFGGFFVTVGIGFICSFVYHFFLWCKFSRECLLIDHTPAAEKIWKAQQTSNQTTKKEEDQKEKNDKEKYIDISEAWNILTEYWFSHCESSNYIKGSVDKVDRFTDIMHGLGTAFTSTFFAFLFWFYFDIQFFKSFPSCPAIFVIILWVLGLFIIGKNYCNVKNRLGEIINGIAITSLEGPLFSSPLEGEE